MAVGSQLDAVLGPPRRSRSAPHAAVLRPGVSMTRKLRPSAGVVKDRDVIVT